MDSRSAGANLSAAMLRWFVSMIIPQHAACGSVSLKALREHLQRCTGTKDLSDRKAEIRCYAEAALGVSSVNILQLEGTWEIMPQQLQRHDRGRMLFASMSDVTDSQENNWHGGHFGNTCYDVLANSHPGLKDRIREIAKPMWVHSGRPDGNTLCARLLEPHPWTVVLDMQTSNIIRGRKGLSVASQMGDSCRQTETALNFVISNRQPAQRTSRVALHGTNTGMSVADWQLATQILSHGLVALGLAGFGCDPRGVGGRTIESDLRGDTRLLAGCSGLKHVAFVDTG